MANFTVIRTDKTTEVIAHVENIAQEAMHEAAVIMAETAKELVPVDSGNLRDSITVEENSCFTDVDYAPVVEYGGVGRPGKPFMRPAAEFAKMSIEKFVRK